MPNIPTFRASSQLLGKFSGHIKLRELRKIPYLTWLDWFRAVPALGIAWGGEAQTELYRTGRYQESWMNLLLIFGAENIVNSPYIGTLPINPETLPQDLANPFAVELGILAILVAIVVSQARLAKSWKQYRSFQIYACSGRMKIIEPFLILKKSSSLSLRM